jgi:hypothetical protein
MSCPVNACAHYRVAGRSRCKKIRLAACSIESARGSRFRRRCTHVKHLQRRATSSCRVPHLIAIQQSVEDAGALCLLPDHAARAQNRQKPVLLRGDGVNRT